ncbi:DDE-type integrase/transposase/recombinase [Flavobacterium enshiense]|uniref:transposase n=1 Tax=Flavobacterium enshiense TaxID=1341165 RepID=UPI00345E023E
MPYKNNRISWDTSVKHYIRLGLYNNLPEEIKVQIPRTNIHRWANETDTKYLGCEVAKFIKEELELIKQTGQSRHAKKVLDVYFKLSETYHSIVGKTRGIKNVITHSKEKIVETIEQVKSIVSLDNALKIFNISRATYQNYKTLVLNKCVPSYFNWCLKTYPQQLVKKEIDTIKTYFENGSSQYWSKSSLYYLGLRNRDFGFCLTTFYKYSKLLGYSSRHLRLKPKYDSLISSRPNQIWCADVTILKTKDGTRHYLHILLDHYSKKVLGYTIEDFSNPKAIRSLLQNAYSKISIKSEIRFITDGGIENVNNTVNQFIQNHNIIHQIAQKDITFSNSKIEAFNKIIKHQFLLPRMLENRKQLENALAEDIEIYNTVRPQQSLSGNTPEETFNGKPICISQYNSHLKAQKKFRQKQNNKNRCKKCY